MWYDVPNLYKSDDKDCQQKFFEGKLSDDEIVNFITKQFQKIVVKTNEVHTEMSGICSNLMLQARESCTYYKESDPILVKPFEFVLGKQRVVSAIQKSEVDECTKRLDTFQFKNYVYIKECSKITQFEFALIYLENNEEWQRFTQLHNWSALVVGALSGVVLVYQPWLLIGMAIALGVMSGNVGSLVLAFQIFRKTDRAQKNVITYHEMFEIVLNILYVVNSLLDNEVSALIYGVAALAVSFAGIRRFGRVDDDNMFFTIQIVKAAIRIVALSYPTNPLAFLLYVIFGTTFRQIMDDPNNFQLVVKRTFQLQGFTALQLSRIVEWSGFVALLVCLLNPVILKSIQRRQFSYKDFMPEGYAALIFWAVVYQIDGDYSITSIKFVLYSVISILYQNFYKPISMRREAQLAPNESVEDNKEVRMMMESTVKVHFNESQGHGVLIGERTIQTLGHVASPKVGDTIRIENQQFKVRSVRKKQADDDQIVDIDLDRPVPGKRKVRRRRRTIKTNESLQMLVPSIQQTSRINVKREGNRLYYQNSTCEGDSGTPLFDKENYYVGLHYGNNGTNNIACLTQENDNETAIE